MRYENPCEQIDDALPYLQKHGWIQGVFDTADGRVCLAGALRHVVTDHYDADLWDGLPQAVAKAHIEVTAIIGEILGDRDEKMRHRLAKWNDVPERTQAEVEDLLREASAKCHGTLG